jgi:tetratricopeptide (TPR) repeat protein
LLVLFAVPALRHNRTVRNGILMTSMVGIVAAIALGRGAALTERFEGIGEQQTQSGFSRLRHWQDVSRAIPDYWRAGSGIGTYRYAYLPYEERFVRGWFYHAENQYFEALLEGGVPGLGLLLIVILITWRSVIRAVTAVDVGSAGVAVAAACLFAVSAVTIHAAFDFNLTMPAVGILFSFFVAVAWNFQFMASPRRAGFLSALAMFATISWVTWSIFQTSRVVQLEETLREVASVDRAHPFDEHLALQQAEKLRSMIQRMPDESEAQLQYARLMVDLFHISLTEELASDVKSSADDDLIWDSTSLSALHARFWELRREGRSFDAVTRTDIARKYLVPAWQAASRAVAASPLSHAAHTLMAQLAPLMGRDDLQTHHGETALRIRPFDPNSLYTLGLLDVQAGRLDAGLRRWQKSLELSSENSKEIVRWSLAVLSHAQFVEKIMPRNVLRSVNVIKRHFADERFREMRPVLGQYLRQLDSSALESADGDYVEALTLDLLNEPQAAAAALERAVAQQPMNISWRFELARLYARTGNLGKAHQHGSVCLRLAPDNRAIDQFLTALERQIRTPPK